MKRKPTIEVDVQESPKKRAKLDTSTPSRTPRSTENFTNADAIHALIKAQNTDLLLQGLTGLRNQLTVKHNEPPIPPQDERLVLLQQWLGDGTSAKDIFDLWETANPKNAALHSLIVSLLSTILSLASSHLTFHAIGHPITKTLLTPTCIRRLNSYLGGSSNELILVSLKLYNSLSTFSGGRERKTVLDTFPWELRSLPKLLNMRRRGKSREGEPFSRPDIRTLYITFLLSFIDRDCPSHVKTMFLEHHRDAFLAIFKGLHQDPYGLVRRIIEVCWTGLCSDPKVKRTLKIGLFNEVTIGHLLKLHGRNTSEDEDPEHVPADLVHHFLLAICSRTGAGICFKDRGWYPREQDAEENVTNTEPDMSTSVSRGSKIYNKILSNILKTLKTNEDPRQQELAIKIMSACPELVAGYWPAAALTLEPRLSSRWLANIAFFGAIISLPLPESSFLLNEDSHLGSYKPTPPPLNAIVENIFPSVNTKANFSKGLQSPSGLVQHSSALALIKCLIKYDQVIQKFREITIALEEAEEDGQWFKRLRDLEKEVRKRVPDFQVIVAFSQHTLTYNTGGADTQSGDQPSAPKMTGTALLAESAQRLFWMYHRALPSLVAEARFDVGKLLHGFLRVRAIEDGEGVSDTFKRLDRVRRLHVIRLLKESDQFAWTGKLPGSSHSYLYILLKSSVAAETSAEGSALCDLLQHVLSRTILFQEDPDEPSLWLMSLPKMIRTASSISPDGAPLTDELESVATFLDDCVQRCMKTPYRYMEEFQVLADAAGSGLGAELLGSYPSPLLITVMEQFNAKLSHILLSPSDVLSLASFLRRLIVNLSMKASDLALLQSVAQRADEILSDDRLFPDYPVLTSAVRKEVQILKTSLLRLVGPRLPSVDIHMPVSDDVADFLTEIAQLSPPSSAIARTYTAYELVDWTRLAGDPIGPDEVNCIIDVVKDFHPPAIQVVADHLDPSEHNIWDAIDVEEYSTIFSTCFSFQQLFIHASESALADDGVRRILSQTLFSQCPTLLEVKRAIRLVIYGLNPSSSGDQPSHSLLLLLTVMIENAAGFLSAGDYNALKEELFTRKSNFRTLCTTAGFSTVIIDVLKMLMRATIQPVTEKNRALVSDICAHWLNVIRVRSELDYPEVQVALMWMDYFPVSDLFELLDELATSVDEMPSSSCVGFLNGILSAVRGNVGSTLDIKVQLNKRLPLLLSLSGILRDYAALEELIAIALGDSLPLCSPSVSITDSDTLSSAVKLSQRRWLHAIESLPNVISAQPFLEQETWTRSTVDILRVLCYRKAIDQDTFASWLGSDHCRRRTAEEYIPILHAFMDRIHSDECKILTHNIDLFLDRFRQLTQTVIQDKVPSEHRRMVASCVALLLEVIPSRSSDIASLVMEVVESSYPLRITPELVALVWHIHEKVPNDAHRAVTLLAEYGLQQLTVHLSNSVQYADIIKAELQGLVPLIRGSKGIKAQHVETILGLITQNHLKEPELVKLATTTLSHTHLKPLVVNKYLQIVLQNQNLDQLLLSGGRTEVRDAIIDLLFTLFNLHPANTCQATHIEPLTRVYRATLSPSDLKLLSIFQLFEGERKLSVSVLFSRWSGTSMSATSLEAIQSLDPNIVFRTSLHYPRWRRVGDQSKQLVTNHDAQLYDPVFLILLFSTMLSENPPSMAYAWVEVFRTNIVGLLIRSLSSKDAHIRDMALCNLASLWKIIQTADMLEKPHVLYILGLIKNVYVQSSGDAPQRLPSYTTLILLHALRGVFYPSNFIYPLTARFLLQRPELDTSDVPMLYSMLYSSSEDWKRERLWIIRMLADGMITSEDWNVLKRRHTWDLLASLFQSSHGDHPLRRGILAVLANITCNPQATLSLTLKSSLLTWIHMQLHTPYNQEDLSWAKILANIVFLADTDRLGAATNDEWRMVVCQCLFILLDASRSSNAAALLEVISPAILKLYSVSKPCAKFATLLDASLCLLAVVEEKVNVPTTQPVVRHVSLPPYTSVCLHDSELTNDALLPIWGRSVELLWQAAMIFDSKPASWEALTVKILTWRSIVGAEQTHIGEWARKSLVCNMG